VQELIVTTAAIYALAIVLISQEPAASPPNSAGADCLAAPYRLSMTNVLSQESPKQRPPLRQCLAPWSLRTPHMPTPPALDLGETHGAGAASAAGLQALGLKVDGPELRGLRGSELGGLFITTREGMLPAERDLFFYILNERLGPPMSAAAIGAAAGYVIYKLVHGCDLDHCKGDAPRRR
jgi:hypothetical protein